MRKILFIAILITCLGSACSAQAIAVRQTNLVNSATEAYKAGDYEKTITISSEAIKLKSTDEAYFGRAMAYQAKGDKDKAIIDLDAALTLNPNHIEALRQRGAIYVTLKEYNKAITDFTKVIQLDPTHGSSVVFAQRGDAYYFQQEYAKAIDDFTQAIQKNGSNANAYIGRANIFRTQGDYAKAISDYDKFIQMYPQIGSAYAGRGDAYFFSTQYDKAIADFNKAISLSSDKVDLSSIYGERAAALFLKGMYQAATTDYTKAIELNSKNAEAYAGRGDAFVKLNDLEKAGLDFNVAIRLDSTRAQTYVNRGDAYFLRGKYADAAADYTTVLKLGITDAKRRIEVEQRQQELQKELQRNPNDQYSSLSLCTWFARAQFIRVDSISKAGNFSQWMQIYSAKDLTAFDQAGLKKWLELLRNYQPYQKQFVNDWIALKPNSAAKSFWDQELNAAQQQLIASDRMQAGYAARNINQFTTGLKLWGDAGKFIQASDQEMLVLRNKCLQ